MTTVRVVCPQCGYTITVSYPEGKPPAALTSDCAKCGVGKMQPEEKAA